MYRVTTSIGIDAPPQAVWDGISDPNRFPQLVHAVRRMVHVPDGPPGAGYTYTEFGGVGPVTSESTWTITEWQPPRRQVHDGDDGTMRFHLEIVIAPTSTGAQLDYRLDVAPRGAIRVPMAVLWPLFLRRLLQRSVERTVANVKRAAEDQRTV